MAGLRKGPMDFGDEGKEFIDSILSREETEDVIHMMIKADETDGRSRLPSFCTSSQMNGWRPYQRPNTPPLSPLLSTKRTMKTEAENVHNGQNREIYTNFKADYPECIIRENNCKNVYSSSTGICSNEGVLIDQETETQDPGTPIEPGTARPENGHGGHDPDTLDRSGEAVATSVAIGSDVTTRREADPDKLGGVGKTDVGDVAEEIEEPEEDDIDKQKGKEVADTDKDDHETKLDQITEKIVVVEEILTMMSERLTKLGSTVRELETSPEFSQSEIETLKKENEKLEKNMDEVEIEDRRTQFQTRALEDKEDRLETTTKKKNLIIEGIPEIEGRREDVEKTIGEFFDQLAVPKGINFEAAIELDRL